jgi:hypothetical protein
MKKLKKRNPIKSVLAGTATLTALTCQSHAQSSDALIDKLVEKGILSVKEAQDLRDEADKNFTTAFQTKTGMPDWVTAYKFSGDFRGRYENISVDSPNLADRTRLRYRLRVGIVVSMTDNLEAGLRLGSGDTAGGFTTGNALSENSTLQDNGSKKNIWIDTAYGKWTPVNSGGWLLSTTIGKMDNPLLFTPMVFDPDYTPEGAALQGGYALNDKHSLAFNSGVFVLDEEAPTVNSGFPSTPFTGRDPFMFGVQLIWNAKWSPKIESALGISFLDIVNKENLTIANVPYINQGNTRNLFTFPNGAGGVVNTFALAHDYNPFVVSGSVTYKLDSFPFYTGIFPIKLAGEFMNNPGAPNNNNGYWAGFTLGKSGTKHTWDINYRYEYLEADAWFDQLVDDDNVAFYSNTVNPPNGGKAGVFSGTNIQGHQVKFNYSITDALMFSVTAYVNGLINRNINGAAEPQSGTLRVMADLMWKF